MNDEFGKAIDALLVAHAALAEEARELKNQLTGYDSILEEIKRLNRRLSSIKDERHMVKCAYTDLTKLFLDKDPEIDHD